MCISSKDETPLRIDLEEYVRTHRGKELPGFLNYRTFEDIIRTHVEELEEPALKLLRNVKGGEQCLMANKMQQLL